MDITMPQLGETVTEGTITRWLKQVGDHVDVDEALFEVSTDKVDSEVPSPSAGYLSEIVVPEGDTVEVGARLAVLSDAPGAAAAPSVPEAPAKSAPDAASAPPPAPEAPSAAPQASAPPAPAPAPPAPAGSPNGGPVTSPIVRRMLAEKGLDPSQVRGTGEGGRITRRDVAAAASAAPFGVAPPPAPAAPVPPAAAQSAPGPAAAQSAYTYAPPPPSAPAGPARGDELVPFDNIRRRTAEHMVRSVMTSAHVYTSMEVDFERVDRVRRAHGAAWRESEGFSLTYLPFVARAFSDAVRDFPHVNASVDGDTLVVHHDVHLGIAVDLAFGGLIAPVIRNVDGKRLRLVAREIHDLAARARSKQVSPDEILGGTFTITNMGPFRTLMTLPIINQPQVAILATDGVRKQPVVVEGPDGDDAIAVHPVGVLALTWDHRAFDGAYAASFLGRMREVLETRDWEVELA